MIIVQLRGGLGNQLFQYAAGLSLATHHRVPVKVDTNLLKGPDEAIGTLRYFELQYLQSAPAIASDAEVNDITRQHFPKKHIQKLLPSYRRSIYNEKQFHFDHHFFEAGDNIYLKGYRQSEKYFEPIKNLIKTEFMFSKAKIDNVLSYGHEIRQQLSVSLHIRRGDYTNQAVVDYHGVLEAGYYQQAIELILGEMAAPLFYIFSDDIEWVKSNLQFDAPVTFVSGSVTKTHYEDFYLMSQCRHNIIANSSFSWWAAWLNNHPDKIVIAPKKWFGNAPNDTKDLIPPSWITI